MKTISINGGKQHAFVWPCKRINGYGGELWDKKKIVRVAFDLTERSVEKRLREIAEEMRQ